LLPPSWKRCTNRYKIVKPHTSELIEQLNFSFGKHLLFTYTSHIECL
jgi:hypothetical protein